MKLLDITERRIAVELSSEDCRLLALVCHEAAEAAAADGNKNPTYYSALAFGFDAAMMAGAGYFYTTGDADYALAQVRRDHDAMLRVVSGPPRRSPADLDTPARATGLPLVFRRRFTLSCATAEE